MLVNTTNKLLLRDDVGHSKPTTWNLPPASHAYGLKPKGNQIAVKDCVKHSNSAAKENEIKKFAKPNEVNPKEMEVDPHIFGIKNRPPTPLNNVINFHYGNEAVKISEKKYQKFNEKKNIKKVLNHKDTTSNKLKVDSTQEYLKRTF